VSFTIELDNEFEQSERFAASRNSAATVRAFFADPTLRYITGAA
jgi:hypothetical protein